MGYTIYPAPSLSARISSHNSDQDERDWEAFNRFQDELRMLIQSDPDYERIFPEYRRYPSDF